MESVHVCSIQIASHLAPSCLRPLGLLAMASVKSMIAASLLAAPCADAFVAPGASQSSHSVTGLRGSTAVKAESGFSTYSALASATTGAAVLSFVGAKKPAARKTVACKFSPEAQVGVTEPLGFFDPAGCDAVIRIVQVFLVDVWQKHIIRWHAGGDLEDKSRSRPNQEITEHGIVENGHLLAPREGGGFWCRLCGKFTSYTEHVRLKITSKPCTQTDGPILACEGYSSNDNRLDKLERELNMKYNKARHLLHWNRKVGKSIGAPDEGWIQCLKCGKKWRWKDRTNNLPRTVCVTTRPTRAKHRITKKTALSKLPRTRYFSERADTSLPFADVSLVDPPRVGVG